MTTITTEEIERILNEKIRPQLALHGGDIRLLDITPDWRARFKLTGACATCPAAIRTMEELVAETLREYLPALTAIEAVHGVSEELLEEARRFLHRSEDVKNSG